MVPWVLAQNILAVLAEFRRQDLGKLWKLGAVTIAELDLLGGLERNATAKAASSNHRLASKGICPIPSGIGTYDDVPCPYPPSRDEAFSNVRVGLGKLPDHGGIVATEDQSGTIDGFRKSPRHDELPPAMCFIGENQVFLAEWHPAVDEIFDDIVQKQIVHVGSPIAGSIGLEPSVRILTPFRTQLN